jgi:translation initiation factor eIF-2B subunit beta
LAVGNIVRRVLKIIREVARGELHGDDNNAEQYDDEEEEVEDDDSDISYQETQKKPNASNQATEYPLLRQSSMFHLLSDGASKTFEESKQQQQQQTIKNTYNLKPLIIQEINEEIIADLESVYKGIADQATDFIHAK